MAKYCVSCHGNRRPKAGINLSKVDSELALVKDPDLAERISEAMTDRSMPPKNKPQPSEAERQVFGDQIEHALNSLNNLRDPGPSVIQRLTRRQYNNTIRDLLGVDTKPADAFPSDGGGGGGFDNNASTLFVPPILMEKYLAAATQVLDQADPKRWKVATPDDKLSKDAAARKCVETFATKAFRRPANSQEVDRLMGLFSRADRRGEPFNRAVKLALRAVLVSPHFLFLVEKDQPGSAPYRVSEYELASRMSYFLWSSMPDDELFRLAENKTLSKPDVLEAQVQRMLKDPKSRAFATDFGAQWLRVDTLASAAEPDRGRYPSYNATLRDAMSEEAIQFFHALMKNNAPVTDLIDAKYTYLNENLAKHYGIEGVKGSEFRKVEMKDANRGGVLGMAAILTLTSYPQRTSPVLRGKWVLEELLGTPPPPPPNNVKVLPPDDHPKGDETFRKRLEAHRKDPNCASCHSKLDPLGFGLESFDAIGRWRTEIGGKPVDASGKLTTGEDFTGPAQLKKILIDSKKDLFVKNLVSRMLSYGVRRGVEYYDTATIRQIATALEQKGYKSTVLVAEIVKSYPFGYRRNESKTEGKP